MSIDDIKKKPRYAKKPPLPAEIPHPGAKPAPSATSTPAAPVASEANKAAQRALGTFDDAPVAKPTTTGAKSAAHGLSFFERAGRSMKKGVLVAMMGMQLIGGTGSPSGKFQGDVPRQQISQVAGQRTAHNEHLLSHQGTSRALPDAQIVLDKWETLAAHDPNFVVDAGKARDLIMKGLLPLQPGPRDDLTAFAQTNLGPETKRFIGQLLDQNRMKVSADARAALEAAIGRTGVTGSVVSSDGKVTVVGDQKGGPAGQGHVTLKGVPGAQVEAINLSTIPTKRLHTDDTFALGTVGADGNFAGNMEMQQGDVIRLRLKMPDGTASAWVDFRADGLGADTRTAEVALFRIGLVDQGNGRISVNNINEGRPVSEPGAVLRFVNTRTGEQTDVTFDKGGTFPANTTLPGKTGDNYDVAVTDGTSNVDFATRLSTLTVREAGKPSTNIFKLPGPTLHHDEMENGKPKFGVERYTGPLFENGAQYTDVTQGQLGDCYFPASIATIAFHVQGHFEKIIQEKRQIEAGTGEEMVWYEVHFKERDWQSGGYKDVVQKVDGDLFVRSWGGPLYGSDDASDRTPAKMEMWFSILEKAYAMWKGGSYEAIGNGGSMDNVFRDILGVDATSMGIYDKDAVWKQVQIAVDKHRPIGAGTHGDDQAALYANTGVYADHAYSILGYKTDGGTQYVQLRNPWGESEPFPGDGKNDGIFWLKLDDFMKLYQNMYYTTQDH